MAVQFCSQVVEFIRKLFSGLIVRLISHLSKTGSELNLTYNFKFNVEN